MQFLHEKKVSLIMLFMLIMLLVTPTITGCDSLNDMMKTIEEREAEDK